MQCRSALFTSLISVIPSATNSAIIWTTAGLTFCEKTAACFTGCVFSCARSVGKDNQYLVVCLTHPNLISFCNFFGVCSFRSRRLYLQFPSISSGCIAYAGNRVQCLTTTCAGHPVLCVLWKCNCFPFFGLDYWGPYWHWRCWLSPTIKGVFPNSTLVFPCL